MATCAYCNTTIIFGGARIGSYRFCNERCAAGGQLLVDAERLPPGEVMTFMHRLHQARCPECDGPGPVDVHTAHLIWSLLLFTQWKNQPKLSCADCGRKRQWQALGISLVAGWWGFPWGFLMTPVQVGRNVIALTRGSDPLQPSQGLERIARLQMAAQARAGSGTAG